MIAGNPCTPADEANVAFTVSITDVRLKSDLSDYTGELELAAVLRITDKLNGTAPVDSGTTADLPFPVTVPCAATAQYDGRLHVLGEHDRRRRAAGRQSPRASGRSGSSRR